MHSEELAFVTSTGDGPNFQTLSSKFSEQRLALCLTAKPVTLVPGNQAIATQRVTDTLSAQMDFFTLVLIPTDGCEADPR
jgi:hypothetical protein